MIFICTLVFIKAAFIMYPTGGGGGGGGGGSQIFRAKKEEI